MARCSTILFLIVVLSAAAEADGPYLSSLSATRTSPLFTTYAAPPERSEFIVDEGYQFVWNDPERGPEYSTDTGGKLCFGFKVDGEFHYALKQFFAEPVVTMSYSDLMRSVCYPFPGIRIEAFFRVYSSRIAIEDLIISNEWSSAAAVSVYPFFDHSDGTIQGTAILPEHDGFTFRHAESPDGWTTGHAVPYEENLADAFIIDTAADAFGGYTSAGTLGGPPATRSSSPQANFCVEWGKVYHADGSECWHRPPAAQQVIHRAGRMAEILTEDAPKWGDVDPNIPGNGYQGCELGNFLKPTIAEGDTFVVTFTCSATGGRGVSTGIVPPVPAAGGVYVEVHDSSNTAPSIPQNVVLRIGPDSLSASLSWSDFPGCRFMVYRRSRATPGRFDLIADDLPAHDYLDAGFRADSAYVYVVLAKDSTGTCSGHSAEVGGPPAARPFFDDVTNPRLVSDFPAGDLRLLALQRDISLGPGSSSHIRIIRGVAPAGNDLSALVMECRSMRSQDMLRAIADDEREWSRVPVISFSDADEEMMYWSTFNMMRQCMLPPEGKCSFNYDVYSREPTWGWGHAGQVFHENLSMLAYSFMDPQSAQASQKIFAERMSAQAQWPAGYVPYRVGPYLDEVNYLAGEYSSSAPWFNYENWEIFKASGDTSFLVAIYPKGVAFYNFWVNERDDDHDGLSEWGGHAFWESVRDYNVIWDLLGGWADPHNANKVEALDLNCELVMEAKSLAATAAALGKDSEAMAWRQKAQARADLINALMWDPETKFYYHVMKDAHTFTYQASNDLKRKEQIGLLPLWAGVADAQRASSLVSEIVDSSTFCRPYGIPLLAYNDPYGGYDAHSVYPEWDFLVFEGLLAYGYRQEARALADRLFAGVIQTLKDHHDFYESYSCDEKRPSDSWLHTYIWTGVVARMLIDLAHGTEQIRGTEAPCPGRFALEQSFPNPFNPTTTIRYALAARTTITLSIFNILGQKVTDLVNGVEGVGYHEVRFDGSGLASGVYFYRLQAGSFVQTCKLLLLK